MNTKPMMSAMPMSMPMMNMMPMAMPTPMMCHMTCEMNSEGMQCMMMPAEGCTMDMLKDMCTLMNSMMQSGMAPMMTCAGMPMMMCCGMPMMPAMRFEMTKKGMQCMMMPMGGMSMDMLKMCCETMQQMMNCGMPMTMCCGTMPMMACMA
jgi:hypothetical protein